MSEKTERTEVIRTLKREIRRRREAPVETVLFVVGHSTGYTPGEVEDVFEELERQGEVYRYNGLARVTNRAGT